MEIRRLDAANPDEVLASRQVTAVAFRTGEHYRSLLDELKQLEKTGNTLPDPAKSDPPYTLWGAYMDNRLIAQVQGIDYQMRYENQVVSMCGIGGVATLPEYRRQGSVKEIMRHLLRDSRSRGQIFSYLYPFSYAFYGRFGYGHGCRCWHVEIPISAFRALPETGRIKRYETADLPAVKTVYDQFSAGMNGMVVRGAAAWSQLLDKDPYLEQRYTYLWSDDSGKTGAWMTFETKAESGGDCLQIIDWASVSSIALRGLLAFINRFTDQYARVKLTVPQSCDLTTLFPEPYPLAHKLGFSGQIRVVDIKAALAMLQRPLWLSERFKRPDIGPYGNRVICIGVDDDFLPENSGLYHLDLNGAANEVSFQPASPAAADAPDPADLHVSARLLATLLLGSQGLADLREHPEIRFNTALTPERTVLLEAMFPRKNAAITDYF
ncbi:MAG: GNAT family N-acetyltransferase [Clostridiaceae bacterium]|nr:GNAT family N-acetyltransferase [Clostridiaceae bacterium]